MVRWHGFFIGVIEYGGVRRRVFGWKHEIFSEATGHNILVLFSKPYVYYFNVDEHNLEECIDYWYLYKMKKIGGCHEIKDFKIHLEPKVYE